MSEDVNPIQQPSAEQATPAGVSNTVTPPAQPASTDISPTVPYTRFKEVNDAKKALEDELNKIRSDREKEERERLKKQEEWQKLAEQLEAEVNQYKPYKEQMDLLLKQQAERNERRIKEIPEVMRTLVPPGLDPVQLGTWLDANAHLLKPPPAPAMDAGVRGDAPRKLDVDLTPEQVSLAKQFGMTVEEYATYLVKGKQKPEN